jgi:hypothetical protein
MSARSCMVVLVFATLLAGCGGDDKQAGDETQRGDQTTRPKAIPSCPARLVRDGVEYLGSGVRLPAQVGRPLGKATIPACRGRSKMRKIAVAEIRGVDPSVAVGEPEDSFTVWVAKSARPQSYPAALERILFGPLCDQTRPFTLAGRWLGQSRSGQPLSARLDATETTGAGSAYRGGIIDLVVRKSTKGLNSRAAFSKLKVGSASIRALVRCVDAYKPNRTFLAESIVSTTTGG